MRSFTTLLLLATSLCAQSTHHWFHPEQPLGTGPASDPLATANLYIRNHAKEIGISPDAVDTVYLHKRYRTEHNGVTHLVYRQRVHGAPVHNAEWSINIDANGSILNTGGRLFDQPEASPPSVISAMKAAAAAARAVNPSVAYYPFQTGAGFDGAKVSFHRGAFGDDLTANFVWYGIRGGLLPAWGFRITDIDQITEHTVIVATSGDDVLDQRTNTLHQSPKGLVYENGPLTNPRPGYPREGPAQFAVRKVVPFTGDAIASPKGWLSGTETAGNNVIAGTNVIGGTCRVGVDHCPPPPVTAKSPSLDFTFPVEVGPDAPHPTSFPDASATNLFYLVNRAHDLFYLAGFDEAAGNFQQDNFAKGGAGGDPVYAYALYGSAGSGFAQLNNAAFSLNENDGTPPRLVMYVNYGRIGQLPGFFTDGSLDGEIVIHEYTHGVSGRLASQLYTTRQGGAMGEGLSDFFALEFTLPDGAPPDGIYPFAEYLFSQPERGIRTRPYSTQMEINPLTYAQLGRVSSRPEVHADGEIFVQALWEVRANLIRQLGEAEGRRRVRTLVVDMMKLAPPKASMLDMRDSLLLADRTGFRAQSQEQIWAGFAKRGLGVLAQTGDGDSIHISPSYDMPSKRGLLGFYETEYTIGEPVRVVLHDSNNSADRATVTFTTSSGDRENFTLRRKGSVFTGQIPTFYPPMARNTGSLDVAPGDSIAVFYDDADTGAGPGLVQHSAATVPDYSIEVGQPAAPRFANERRLGLVASNVPHPLPFEFPFFDRKYSEVRVYQSGALVFGGIDFSPCADIESLRQIPAIAPMWGAVRVAGSAQPGEDVYVSTTADSVSFRWAGETAPRLATQPISPVNFAATLFADGRIVFQYGAGNQNLGSSGQQVNGCPNGNATVGISNGHEAFVQIARTHDGSASLENAGTLIWEPPLSNRGGTIAELELPKSGQSFDDQIVVQGVAYDADTSVRLRRIDVLIDGRAVTNIGFGALRSDYCRDKQIPQCPAVGFRQIFNASNLNLSPGAHTIQLRATNTRAVVTIFPEQPLPFTVSRELSPAPTGEIEAPVSGAILSGNTIFRGYVSAPGVLISAVDILVDGVTYGRATYNLPRPEVCAAMVQAAANCPGIGFQFGLNTRTVIPPLSNGAHTLQARALDESGRFTIFPDAPITFTVNNSGVDPPQGVLVSPAHNAQLSGLMRISGHAWDPSGRIVSVVLSIDNEVREVVPYGRPRPEVCAELPDVAACPNIGFELEFDTRRLSNGPHIVSISLTNDRGTSAVLPLAVSNGINVTVSNP